MREQGEQGSTVQAEGLRKDHGRAHPETDGSLTGSWVCFASLRRHIWTLKIKEGL